MASTHFPGIAKYKMKLQIFLLTDKTDYFQLSFSDVLNFPWREKNQAYNSRAGREREVMGIMSCLPS